MKDEMFNELLKSVKEADKILKGKRKASRVFELSAPDIVEIRKKLKVSQEVFASMIGVSVDSLQNWEQERRRPPGPALALLTMFKNNPKEAFKILHGEKKSTRN